MIQGYISSHQKEHAVCNKETENNKKVGMGEAQNRDNQAHMRESSTAQGVGQMEGFF